MRRLTTRISTTCSSRGFVQQQDTAPQARSGRLVVPCRLLLPLLLTVVATSFVSPRPAPAGQLRTAASGFAAQVAELSEPGGYFDADNLISNERSYLQVM